MLEHPSICIDPFNGLCRFVRDGVTGVELGDVSRVRPSWLLPPLEAVCEGPDDSLVMTVGRPRWFAPVHVFDSEGQAFAIVRGRLITTVFGEPMAMRQSGVFSGPHGNDLATWSVQAGETTLTFQPCVADDPFVKMALFAAVLRL